MNYTNTASTDYMKLSKIPEFRKPNLINFAGTDFLSLRESLIDYAKAVYAEEYEYFVESDLGMMFLELTAYMGAVLSMKADMLANENFLATATQRSSIKKLLELIGIRLKGPTSAIAGAKLTFSPPAFQAVKVSTIGNISGDFEVPPQSTTSDDSTQTTTQPGTTTTLGTGGELGTQSLTLGSITIKPESRVVQITSPEDGGAVSYTLYKIVNGLVPNLDKYTSTNDVEDLILYDVEKDSNSTAENAIFTNLVLREGALVRDTGEFAATEAVKTIELTQGPVVEGSIQVYISDVEENTTGPYTQVQNLFFASGVNDKIFEVIYDDDYKATVVFGNGITGANPSTNAKYTVLYRVGGGTRGNLNKNIINYTTTFNNSQVTITNITKATGGSNAESVERAKKFGPLIFRSQDRLVTLVDYSVFANTFISSFGTVGKATAVARNSFCTANTIDIYVLEKASDLQLQKATPVFKKQLLEAIDKKRMATDEVVIVDGLIRTLDLVTTVKIDKELQGLEESIKTKVRNKILTYMNVENREFGESLNISELNREIFEVEEIRYSTIDNIDQDIFVDFNEIIQLNNLTIKVEYLD